MKVRHLSKLTTRRLTSRYPRARVAAPSAAKEKKHEPGRLVYALYVKLARRSSATSPNARDILGVTCRTVANEALAIVRRLRATAL